uniref:Insulin-like androgenic gland hormone n=1 Tax=Chaceon quinquedens TaxID=198537 RepID=A0A1Z2RPB7_CHAQN|nr:insulin-like androgenic gland hormone [Chaceon quinquedens]
MFLPVIILLMLLTATQTKADANNFSVDCANLPRTLSSVCLTYKQPPNNRHKRDTESQGADTPDDTNPAFRPRPPHAVPMITDDGPILSPELAFQLVKTQWTGGRFRRSQRSVNAYDECCPQSTKNCTVYEVAGYCATLRSPYREIIAAQNQ